MEETPTSAPMPASPPRRRAIAAAALVALGLVSIPLAMAGPELVPGDYPGIYGDGFGLGAGAFLGLLYAAIALWAVLLPFAPDLGVRPVAIAAGALILLFVLAPPLLSLDVFSYIAYARLGADHGLNPYEFAPAAIPFDDVAGRVEDYRDAVSVYGPLFTLGTYPLGTAGVGFALWSLKAVTGIAVAAIAWIVARLAALRGVSPAAAIAFVALNPIVLVQLVGGAHNDALMAALAIAAVAAALTSRPASAGVGLVLAASIKVSGLIYAPFAFVGSRQRGRLLAAALAAAAVVALASLAIFGTSVTEALSVVGGNQDRISRWSVPATAARITGIDVDALRVVLAVGVGAALAWLVVATARGLDWVRAAGWGCFAVLFASAYIVPWYLIWLVPIAAIARDRALVAATILFTVFQAMNGVPV